MRPFLSRSVSLSRALARCFTLSLSFPTSVPLLAPPPRGREAPLSLLSSSPSFHAPPRLRPPAGEEEEGRGRRREGGCGKGGDGGNEGGSGGRSRGGDRGLCCRRRRLFFYFRCIRPLKGPRCRQSRRRRRSRRRRGRGRRSFFFLGVPVVVRSPSAAAAASQPPGVHARLLRPRRRPRCEFLLPSLFFGPFSFAPFCFRSHSRRRGAGGETRETGTGSFGRVQLARHLASGQVCAIKSLSKAHLLRSGQVAHLISEKDVLGSLSGEPAFVRLLATFQVSLGG